MVPQKKPLNQRQWLNIMTVATAFMILIFVMVGKVVEKKLTPESSDRPFSDMQKIRIADWSAELNKDGCLQSRNILSAQQCLSLFDAWRNFSPSAWLQDTRNAETVLNIEITLPSNQQQWQLKWNQLTLLQQTDAPRAIILNPAQTSELFPTALLQTWSSSTP